MNRIVIVTGAGAGLGRALARELAANGDHAIGFGRDAASLAETGAGLDTGFEAMVVDIADFDAVAAATVKVFSRHGRVEGLFANAAVYPRMSLIEQSPEDWMHVLRVNVGGVASVCRAVLPVMMRAAHGRIVTVGSFADAAPVAGSSAYSASKGALRALTRAIAVEVGDDYPDILVNEWVPGALATKMGVPEGIDPSVAARLGVALLDLPPGGPTGRLFDRDRLVEPPRSLKRRVLARLRLG